MSYTKIGTVIVSVDTEKNSIQFETSEDKNTSAIVWMPLKGNIALNHLVDELLRIRNEERQKLKNQTDENH